MLCIIIYNTCIAVSVNYLTKRSRFKLIDNHPTTSRSVARPARDIPPIHRHIIMMHSHQMSVFTHGPCYCASNVLLCADSASTVERGVRPTGHVVRVTLFQARQMPSLNYAYTCSSEGRNNKDRCNLTV